jgi:tetratricopeptide (TPR) repeat protein
MSTRVLATATFVLAFAVYANSLGNEFVWDDTIIVARQLPLFDSPSAVLQPPPAIPQYAPDYYRPLVIASYLFDRATGSGRAWTFHLTVVLAHALATVAVFGLGTEIFRRSPRMGAHAATAAALAAALFAVHPVHTEAVAWIAGRADVFSGLFAIVAVWAHLRSPLAPGLAWVAGAALFLALLSKEVAVSLVLLLPAADLLLPPATAPGTTAVVPRAQRRRAVPPRSTPGTSASFALGRWLPLAAAVGVYATLRLSSIGHGVTTTSGEAQGSIAASLVAALAVYAGKLVLPWSLNAYVANLPQGVASLAAGALAGGALAAAFVWGLRSRRGAIAFLSLWLGAALAPSLTILFKIPEVPVAERYLYLPSVALCLLLGYGAGLALASERTAVRVGAVSLVAAALVVGSAVTVARNRVWASDLALWTDTAARNPGVSMPLRSLGTALLREQRIEAAEHAYEAALALPNTDVGRVTLLSNLGSVALTRGSLDRAEDLYRQAAAIHAAPDAQYNLGVIGLRRADQARDERERAELARAALAELRRAEASSPLDPDIQLALAEALTILGRGGEARVRYERALALGLADPAAGQVRARLAERPESK